MSVVSNTDLLDRLLEPVTSCLSPDVAQRLVSLRADAKTQARIDKLAESANEGELSDEVTSFDPADMFTVPNHIEGSAGDVVGLLVVAALFYKLLTVREFSLGPYLVHEGGQTLKSYRRFFCHGCSDRLVWILVGIPGGNIVPLQLVTNRIEIADCPSRRRVI